MFETPMIATATDDGWPIAMIRKTASQRGKIIAPKMRDTRLNLRLSMLSLPCQLQE